MYNSSGLFQYNHPDWLGSARLFSTPSRGANPAMAYAPFGEGYAGGQQWIQFTSAGNAWTVAYNENQTGSLEDFMFRRYSPSQSRWISPDPAGLAAVDPTNPQTWNRYAYVDNNPLSSVDPLGLYLSYPGSGVCEQAAGDTCVSSTPTDPGGDNNGYYFMGMPISSSTFQLLMQFGSGQTAVTFDNGTNGSGGMLISAGGMAFLPWGSTTGLAWGGEGLTTFLGGSTTEWGDWVNFSGSAASYPGSITTMIPGGSFVGGGGAHTGLPGVPKSPNPILQYDQCATNARSQVAKASKPVTIINGISVSNGIGLCAFAGPDAPLCAGVLGGIGTVNSLAIWIGSQITIYDAETACLQAQ